MSTVKRELSIDPWKYCSSGSCKSFNKSNSFTLDCLKSPADPTTWRGASSHARFGLDIGGTLCKVVYFEPFENLVSPALSGDTSPVDPLIERAVNSNDSHFIVDSVVQGDCMSENGTGAWQGKQHGATLRDSSIGTSSCPTFRNGVCAMDNCISHHEEVKLKDGCVNCEVVNGKLEAEANTRGHIGKAKSMSQVHKIWTSSHAPVVLSGRGTLYFKCFETWRMEEFLLLTKEHSLVTGGRALGATGGGARKFNSQFYDIAGLQLKRADELISLVRGIDFLTKHSQHETFEYPKGSFQGGAIQRPIKSPEDSISESDGSSGEDEGLLDNDLEESAVNPHSESVRATSVPKSPCESGVSIEGNQSLYPYLVVNIGSGVSILLVESPDKFQRVGGTSLGGSTFFGLTSALTGCSSFQEAIDLAAEGDSTEIDMLVGDIYGGDYSEMGLAATTVASSFGKPSRRSTALKMPQHLAKATLLMITNNIGSLAKLHAQATGADRVLFTGSFMHGNKLAMRLLAVAMEFWSKGQIKAIFLQHEGHAGAMGALLSALDPTNPTDFLLLR